MLYLETNPGTFVPWTGQPINETSYPLNIEQVWTDADLKDLGLYRVVDDKPPLGAGQYYGEPTTTFTSGVGVTRTWPVLTYDYPTMDQGQLNAALAEPGSVVRALGLVMFAEINKLRVKNGDPAYTMPQFVAALKAQMR